MRSKEEANDYRYFPEPDLVPLAPDPQWQARVRATLGPMPADRRAGLVQALGGEASEAETEQVRVVVDLGLDGLVTAAVGAGAPIKLALTRTANEVAADVERAAGLAPESFAALVTMEAGGKVSATQSKAVLAALLESGGDPAVIAREMGFEAMGEGALAPVVAQVVGAHPDEWARYLEGENKLSGFFVKAVMDATANKANGKEVIAELLRLKG